MTLTESVVSLRRTLLRMLTKRLAQEQARPFQQLRLLAAVSRGQAETQTEVAELLVSDPATICRLVDRLAEDGLVERLPGKDRRSGRLQVTEAAQPHLATLKQNVEWLDDRVRSALTEEEERTLLRLLEKVHAGLAGEAISSR